jgi:hypothetical protein
VKVANIGSDMKADYKLNGYAFRYEKSEDGKYML